MQDGVTGQLKVFVIVPLDFRNQTANRFGGGPAIDTFGTLVPIGDAMIEPADKDGIPGKIKQRGLLVGGEAGGLQLLRALLHAFFEIFEMRFGLDQQARFFRERNGELQHLDDVEGLFENEHAVARLDLLLHLTPRTVGIGGANDDLHVRADLPDLPGGFDPVPARRHAHIHESHGIGVALRQRTFDHLQPLLPLGGGVDREGLRLTCGDGGAKQRGFSRLQGIIDRLGRCQNFAEVVMNRPIVVDDENPPVQGCGGRVHQLGSPF